MNARFHTENRSMPDAWSPGDQSKATTVSAYYDGGELFALNINPRGGVQVSVWTTADGLQAVIDSCHVALSVGRPRIALARDAAAAEVPS